MARINLGPFQLMQLKKKIWVGVDPGGVNSFGVAILQGKAARSWCVSSADEAIETIAVQVANNKICGVGVDAPLWWSSGRSSDRMADQWIRRTYEFKGGQVQTANSLRGAVLVQGAMFVMRLRERYPRVPVTESHPKALMRALKLGAGQDVCARFNLARQPADLVEHERDAIISAISAREGFEGRWRRDLSLEIHESEQDPRTYWNAPVHYFWPTP